MTFLQRPRRKPVQKQYFYTSSEIAYHKDIALIAIANAIFTVSTIADSEELGIFVLDKEKYKDEIKDVNNELFSFIEKYHFLINGLKQRDLANIQKIKDAAKSIYSDILSKEEYHKYFNLEMFAINILMCNFIDSKNKISNSLSHFMDKQRLKKIIDITCKCTGKDDFIAEYKAAMELCKKVKEIQL